MVTIEDARTTAAVIVKTLHPLSIVLFGSVARDSVGADMDLLVVTDEKSDIVGDPALVLHKRLKRFYRKFAIDPFIVSRALLVEHYAKGSSFLRLISKEGRALYMRDAVKEWVRQSSDECSMAEYLLKGGYFKGACYHAQQSIEKTIKARLLQKGWGLEKIHNIERLLAIGRDYKIRFNLSDEEIVFVDSIYRGRYPAEAGLLPLGEPSQKDAQKAVSLAKRILRSVQTSLKNNKQ